MTLSNHSVLKVQEEADAALNPPPPSDDPLAEADDHHWEDEEEEAEEEEAEEEGIRDNGGTGDHSNNSCCNPIHTPLEPSLRSSSTRSSSSCRRSRQDSLSLSSISSSRSSSAHVSGWASLAPSTTTTLANSRTRCLATQMRRMRRKRLLEALGLPCLEAQRSKDLLNDMDDPKDPIPQEDQPPSEDPWTHPKKMKKVNLDEKEEEEEREEKAHHEVIDTMMRMALQLFVRRMDETSTINSTATSSSIGPSPRVSPLRRIRKKKVTTMSMTTRNSVSLLTTSTMTTTTTRGRSFRSSRSKTRASSAVASSSSSSSWSRGDFLKTQALLLVVQIFLLGMFYPLAAYPKEVDAPIVLKILPPIATTTTTTNEPEWNSPTTTTTTTTTQWTGPATIAEENQISQSSFSCSSSPMGMDFSDLVTDPLPH